LVRLFLRRYHGADIFSGFDDQAHARMHEASNRGDLIIVLIEPWLRRHFLFSTFHIQPEPSILTAPL
jgi:hypothetical protein